jgi:hypothetical protein
MMNFCRQCVSTVQEGVAVCVQCGAAIEQGTTQTQQDISAWPSGLGAAPARKFGGWLIPVALSLAISPLLHLRGVCTNLAYLCSSRYQAILAAMPSLPGILIYETVTNATFLVAMIGLNVLFYQKRKAFPGLMIAYLAGQIVPVVIDELLVQGFKPAAGLAVFWGSILPAMILIPYYLRSERVKLTFVN